MVADCIVYAAGGDSEPGNTSIHKHQDSQDRRHNYTDMTYVHPIETGDCLCLHIMVSLWAARQSHASAMSMASCDCFM